MHHRGEPTQLTPRQHYIADEGLVYAKAPDDDDDGDGDDDHDGDDDGDDDDDENYYIVEERLVHNAGAPVPRRQLLLPQCPARSSRPQSLFKLRQ